jgi:crossover junction endodeoxyribonuclease RuvC
MRIIGVDPGYDRLGVAVIERQGQKEQLIYSDCLSSGKKDDFSIRLFNLGEQLEKVITQHQPEALAIETLFFAKNKKTASAVAETRGLILYLAGKHNLPVIECSPGTVKLTTTGYGRADKAQISAALGRLIRIEKEIKYDDEYDAIAVALTGLSTTRLK